MCRKLQIAAVTFHEATCLCFSCLCVIFTAANKGDCWSCSYWSKLDGFDTLAATVSLVHFTLAAVSGHMHWHIISALSQCSLHTNTHSHTLELQFTATLQSIERLHSICSVLKHLLITSSLHPNCYMQTAAMSHLRLMPSCPPAHLWTVRSERASVQRLSRLALPHRGIYSRRSPRA